MSEQVQIDIDTDGTVQIETKGFKGKKCTDVTRQLEQALGTVKTNQFTPEYYQLPPQQQQVRR